MAGCTDSGANPLFDNRIVSIWRKRSMYDVYKILRGCPAYCYRARNKGGNGAASAPLCKRYYLTGILPPVLGQVCNISIILWGFFKCCNPKSSLLDSFQTPQQAICSIRDICWRVCLDGIRPGHWQRPSNKIVGCKLITCNWLTRLMCSIFIA